jgi:hypothetical protein
MSKSPSMQPDWVDEYLPFAGACAFCDSTDKRHRVIDAIRERVRAGDPVNQVAADYELPQEFVVRLMKPDLKALRAKYSAQKGSKARVICNLLDELEATSSGAPSPTDRLFFCSRECMTTEQWDIAKVSSWHSPIPCQTCGRLVTGTFVVPTLTYLRDALALSKQQHLAITNELTQLRARNLALIAELNFHTRPDPSPEQWLEDASENSFTNQLLTHPDARFNLLRAKATARVEARAATLGLSSPELRAELLGAFLDEWQDEHGGFSPSELSVARRLFGITD